VADMGTKENEKILEEDKSMEQVGAIVNVTNQVKEVLASIQQSKETADKLLDQLKQDNTEFDEKQTEQLNALKTTSNSLSEQLEQIKINATNKEAEYSKTIQELSTVIQNRHGAAITAINQAEQKITPLAKQAQASKDSAQQDADTIQKTKTAVEAQSKAITQNSATVKENHTKSTALYAETQKFRDTALEWTEKIKKDGANVSEILKTADTKDKKVNEYQEQLSKLIKESNDLRKKINDLLPGAVSASLAKAFTDRKKDFTKPKIFWSIMQMISLFGFIGMAIYMATQGEPTTWQGWLILLIKKSPIFAGLVFIEEIARRNYNVAERLEEDYGYKAVLSSSFIGYRDQMSKIGEKENKAVSKLADSLLNYLGKEPGRLIDKVRSVKRPVTDVIEQVNEMVKGKDKE